MKQLIKESEKRVKKLRKEVDDNSKEVKNVIKKLWVSLRLFYENN